MKPDLIASRSSANLASASLAIVSVSGRLAGLVSRQERGFLFHASDHRFNDLDGQSFASVGEARTAARHLVALEALSPRALKPWS